MSTLDPAPSQSEQRGNPGATGNMTTARRLKQQVSEAYNIVVFVGHLLLILAAGGVGEAWWATWGVVQRMSSRTRKSLRRER